jgi:hypothetical protein
MCKDMHVCVCNWGIHVFCCSGNTSWAIDLRDRKDRREGIRILTIKNTIRARHRWLTSVVLATWEAEIRRIEVPAQPSPGGKKKLQHHTLKGKK